MKPPEVGKCTLSPWNESCFDFLFERADLRSDLLRSRLFRELSDQLPRDLTGYFLTTGGRATRQAAMMPTLTSMELLHASGDLKHPSQYSFEAEEGLTRRRIGSHQCKFRPRCARL